MKSFEICGGSIIGTDHSKPGKPGFTNCQDALAYYQNDTCIVAIVCDGCSGSPHSEIGAKLGAQLLVSLISTAIQCQFGQNFFWERIKQQVLGQISVLAQAMGGSYSQVVYDYFLFAFVGVLVTPSATYIFSCGDGFYSVNGQIENLGPFPENTPPYLAYNLTGSKLTTTHPELLNIQVRTRPTCEIQNLLIATDGLSYLLNAAGTLRSGTTEPVAPIGVFWEDRFYQNSDSVRRHLAVINRERIDKGILIPGPLKDDLALVAIRRKPDEKELS